MFRMFMCVFSTAKLHKHLFKSSIVLVREDNQWRQTPEQLVVAYLDLRNLGLGKNQTQPPSKNPRKQGIILYQKVPVHNSSNLKCNNQLGNTVKIWTTSFSSNRKNWIQIDQIGTKIIAPDTIKRELCLVDFKHICFTSTSFF